MSRVKSAWGMEVGAAAIKAVRLERDGDKVTVTDFAVVPHKKVLATPDVDQDDMTRLSLGQFISQKDLEGEHLVISVPGHAAFARFAKLPPVEPKKVPDIVKFEAVQQIPFPIEQVEWDYQTFGGGESPEVEVGIFAITRERVQQRLGLYSELGIAPESLTLSPVAVYNAMAYDHDLAERSGPVIYLDIGTSATDVIVAEAGRCWIRTFPLGGTHFTEAIANAFKLSYSKAEKLKHEAASSKYAKQIMQAMRPVFTDLLQDLQRSIGYYQTLNRDAELTTMVGVGSTFKIPGLRKFLGQQLQMQVMRLDEYKKIQVSGREAAAFAQNAVGLATAYGLALQGVGLSRISANLVPTETVRAQMWRSKTKWFAAAAVVMALGSAMLLYRPIADRSTMSPQAESPEVSRVLATGKQLKSKYDDVSGDNRVGHAAENFRRLVDYRTVWPSLLYDAAQAAASTDPQPELLSDNAVAIKAVDPETRRLVRLKDLSGVYELREGDRNSQARVITVTMDVELTHKRPVQFLRNTVAKWLRDNAEREGVPYRIVAGTVQFGNDMLSEYEMKDGAAVSVGRKAPSRPKSGGSQRPGLPPSGPKRAPPGKDSGGSPGGFGSAGGGSPGGFGAAGGGDIGRRQKGGKRSAPGQNMGGGFGAAGGGGATGGAPSGGDYGRRDRTGGGMPGGGDVVESHADLDAYGPVPERPKVLPDGAKFYVATITFEVELLDAKQMSQKPAKGDPA